MNGSTIIKQGSTGYGLKASQIIAYQQVGVNFHQQIIIYLVGGAAMTVDLDYDLLSWLQRVVFGGQS